MTKYLQKTYVKHAKISQKNFLSPKFSKLSESSRNQIKIFSGYNDQILTKNFATLNVGPL